MEEKKDNELQEQEQQREKYQEALDAGQQTVDDLRNKAKEASSDATMSGSDINTIGKTNSYNESAGSNVNYSTQTGSSKSVSQKEVSPDVQAAADKAYAEAMAEKGYVPDGKGGWVLNHTLYDALNIPREDLRKERERQQRQNRMKEIAAGIYHTGALLSDMISAGVGGNVWKREKDDTASKAVADNNQLRSLQLAEDIAFADKQRKDKEEALNEANKRRDQYIRDFAKTVSDQTHENSGFQQGYSNNVTVGEQTSEQNSKYSQDMKNRSRGYGSYGGRRGSGSGETKILKVQLKNGQNVDVKMPVGQYDASGRYLSSLYNALSASGNDNIAKVLDESGLTPGNDGTYDGADLLASGIVFDNPKVRAEFVKAIYNDSSLTDAERNYIINEMQIYPTNAPKEQKKGFLKRIWEGAQKFFGGGEEKPAQQGNDRAAKRAAR